MLSVSWEQGLGSVVDVELRLGLWETLTLETVLLDYAVAEGIGMNAAWIVVGCLGMDALLEAFPEDDSSDIGIY